MVKTLRRKSSAQVEDEDLLKSEESLDEENPENEDLEDLNEGIPEAELEGQDVHQEGIPDTQDLIREIQDGNGSGKEEDKKSEVLLENSCTVDKELYFEAVQAMSTKKYLVIAVIAAILVPVGLMMNNRVVSVVALVIAVLALCFRPLVGYRDYRRLKKRHPEGCWTKKVQIYSEYVVTSTEDEEKVTVVPIEDLKKIRNTEHLCILDFGKKAPATLMDKDGFLIGSAEELQYLMKNLQREEADRRAAG